MSAIPKLPGMMKALGGPAGAALTGLSAAAIGAPVVGAITGSSSKQRIEDMIRAGYNRDFGARDQMVRLAELMQENEANMALLQPRLYAELLMGRRLGRGTFVFGEPDRSTLDNALLSMSKGRFGSGEQA